MTVTDHVDQGDVDQGDDVSPAEPSLVGKIVRLNLLVSKALDDVTAAFGITMADYLVLAVVRRSPGARTTPSRIAEVLRRTTGGMTLTVDRLERSGWLTRSADPTDRRRVLVSLTAAGHRIAVDVNRDLHRWEDLLALPARSRERIDTELNALLVLFED